MLNEKKSRDLKTGWDDAIRAAKAKIKRLEAAIDTFKEQKCAGRPFPTGTELKHKHKNIS